MRIVDAEEMGNCVMQRKQWVREHAWRPRVSKGRWQRTVVAPGSQGGARRVYPLVRLRNQTRLTSSSITVADRTQSFDGSSSSLCQTHNEDVGSGSSPLRRSDPSLTQGHIETSWRGRPNTRKQISPRARNENPTRGRVQKGTLPVSPHSAAARELA